MADPLPIARNAQTELVLLPALANRHGLITGATGTGKTVTLQVMAERFSGIGVPVFMADVKGDLSGITQPGAPSPKLLERLKLIGVPEPARPARTRATGRREVSRRADAQYRRPLADRYRRTRRREHSRRRQAAQRAEALFDVAAVAPLGALRAPARGRRPGQA